jgi:hypothetical protein
VIFHREGTTVRPPEDLVVHMYRASIPEDIGGQALRGGIVAAFGVAVVHQVMHLDPFQGYRGRMAQELGGGRVAEDADPLGIDAKDALPGGFQ